LAATVYETMFILNANAYARNPGGAADTIRDMVTNVGGKVLASRLWNEQKLAYPVRGQRKGVYWLTYFQAESTSMPKFNRACQLQDMILRHLSVRIDPRLAETLVAVARGEKTLPVPDIDKIEKEKAAAREAMPIGDEAE
jgi:small subunit ribosomal protein S6